MENSITSIELNKLVNSTNPPLIIDVRRKPAFLSSSEMMIGALRRDPETINEWSKNLPLEQKIIVYCVKGHEVSQNASKFLRDTGRKSRFVVGGLEEGWKAEKLPTLTKPKNSGTSWVTREKPKIDRVACPWLVSRFVDSEAQILFVPSENVKLTASEKSFIPFDIPDQQFSHDGELCSFDAFIKYYHLSDPALKKMAVIIRGADTNKLNLAPQAAGLLAISLGLSSNFNNDHEMLAQGMIIYDALYSWCKKSQNEVHSWDPTSI